MVGRDSSVGVAVRCGLDGPEIEPRRRRGFPHMRRPFLVPNKIPVQRVPGLFPDPGRGFDHPPPSSSVVKEKVELYLYSPSGSS
jgi:hypothetical protein